jgi:Fic family protein
VATPKEPLFTDDDIRTLDASYQSFPSFSEWLKTSLDLKRWQPYTALLADLKQSSPNLLHEAQDIVERAAAVDTGALEGLYEVDRGFTFTVAREAALWEVTVQKEKGDKVLGYIKAQLEAYEYILDIATKQTPLTEKAIRELHEVMCRNQDTYQVYTLVGPQERKLSKGQYKVDPNHVLGRDGEYHAYAPVDGTPMEMRRFVLELQSDVFQQAHPVLQASYAHYAFVLIHPFADGNGRVARALASIYTYRDQSVPILILSEEREGYLNALADADAGNYQPFVDFTLERTLNSIQLFSDSIQAAKVGSSQDTLARLISLSRTKGGYLHSEVDRAGNNLILSVEEVFRKEFQEEKNKYPDVFEFSVTLGEGIGYGEVEGYDYPKSYREIYIGLSTKVLPVTIEIRRGFDVIIPKDSGLNDDFWIRKIEDTPVRKAEKLLPIRATELIPQMSGVTQMRLSIYAQGITREMFTELEKLARQSLGRS